MLSKLLNIGKKQEGFTFIEVIVALAITGLIVGGIALAYIQLVTGHFQSSGEMTALRQVQNTGYHISRDTKMAENIDINDDPETTDITEVFTIFWTEVSKWKSEPLGDVDEVISEIIRHKIVYTLDDGIIHRIEYYTDKIREDDDDYVYPAGNRIETRVAQYITEFNFSMATNILTVTATTGGFGSQTETRSYEVEPRPDTIYWQ